MQVPVLGSGEILRLLEAMLPLPKLEHVPIEHKAAPTLVREDEAILRYASVPHLVQSIQNAPAATPAPVSQKTNVVGQVITPPPHVEQAVLQMPVAHAISHSGYASYHQAATLSQGAINVPAYIPPFLPSEDRPAKLEPARRGRAAGWGQIARASARKLWTRAPLLALLLAWLVAGFVVAVIVPVHAVFDVWGLGFLALVGFGFYTRVRNVRF